MVGVRKVSEMTGRGRDSGELEGTAAVQEAAATQLRSTAATQESRLDVARCSD